MNGEKLRILREAKGLSQRELGKIINASASTVGMYERDSRQPDNFTLKLIAKCFNVTTDYLLDYECNSTEMEDILVLKQVLVNNGYMNDEEILTTKEFENVVEFVVNNRKYIKGVSKEVSEVKKEQYTAKL